MNIGIDIDGVIANFVGTFIPLAQQRYGISFTERDIYVHDLYVVLGITEAEALELIRATITSDPRPYDGAVEALRRIHAKHDVVLMTARPKDLMDVTAQWLARWSIAYRQLVHLDEGFKHEASLSLDIIVDDHLREALGFVGKVPHIVVFDRPWNQTLNVARLFERVRTWEELVDLIRRLSP
jgi:uncharacterized HAD superfamily protein